MKHKLEPEMINLAYQAEHMRPRVRVALERLETGEGTTDDLIEISKHYRSMGQDMAARHVRKFALQSVLASTFLVLVLALMPACESVDFEPSCKPSDCAGDCLSMNYGAGFCYAADSDPDDLTCWCLDPKPGNGACIERDQGCRDGVVWECTGEQWRQQEGDVCNPIFQFCREYLAPDPDGGIFNRAKCQERGCE